MNINLDNQKFFLSLIADGILTISNDGTVFNTKTRREIGTRSKETGYKAIGYKKGGKTKHALVHRLVHILYNDGFTEEQPYCNHKDGDKGNNHHSNLERCSYSENNEHAILNGLRDNTNFASYERYKGEQNCFSKIKNYQAKEIREKYSTRRFSHRDLALEYGLAHTTIGRIIRRERYKNDPYQAE